MKKIILPLIVSVSLYNQAEAQEKKTEEKKVETTASAPAAKPQPVFSTVIGGFVRTDYIWDSRKNAQVRENHLNLYPSDVVKDANGKDLNAVPQSNFLSIVSRINLKITGPDAFGAKTSAFFEGDFFGNTEGTIGLFRLRHANASLDWTKTKLTLGQSWYPQFIPECFPGVANFSTGILFNPFGWVSQAKVTHSLSKTTSFALTVYKDREFGSVSPTGVANEPSVNSVMPTIHGNLQYKNAKVLLGIGAEARSLKPRTSITGGTPAVTIENTGKVNSLSVNAYAKITGKKATLKAYGILGQNITQMVMLGGYVSVASTSNPFQEEYKPTKTNAFWLELMSNDAKVAPALFLGYTVNNGADVAGKAAYARGISLEKRSVKDVVRAAGRIDFKSGKMRFSPELEYTAANWGNADKTGKVSGTLTNVGNVRFLFSTAYTF
ncbi:hypothetical protein EMA8858_01651 [Emticicia aquatica]|jgi:hypothetical protein|uniref:Porin n=1 Tax=Emticicia aquatica TaxID=1681835 RepID=A0ABM9ANU1_9BACT|nr:hypothetical protein [Emticicia aquatica]CAH0995528.1 hypothetical protein EMA8858_01651 [Emticicia aquatica]